MVAFDATTLLLLFFPNVRPPRDTKGDPIIDIKDRLEYVVRRLERNREKVVIPTPALSEMLIHAGNAREKYIDIANRSSCFRIVPFDERAAIEAAMITKAAILRGNKRAGSSDNWPKVKFDRQIVAIAKVEAVSAIYSDDDDVERIAKSVGIPVIRVGQLALDPDAAQASLPLKK